MKKLIGSPLVRISVGLVMLTCCILLMFEFIGLVPNPKTPELQYRKVLVESLAVQLNSDITANRLDNVKNTLKTLVARNDRVLSSAVRKNPDHILASFGEHKQEWRLKPTEKSTATQVQVPIYKQGKRWGTIEVSFKKLQSDGTSFYILVLFVALSGFICYLLFLKRTMLELDPSSVVPERVRNALNTFSEGLLIIDNKEQIIFSNESFINKSKLTNESLIGKKASDLDWQLQTETNENIVLPWISIINGKPASCGMDLKLLAKSGKYVSFKVNVSPIGVAGDITRGALVTFTDITELELKNIELGRILDKLKLGQKEIAAQNKELKYLATRDPLTSCLNRRSFFDGLKVLINEEKKQGNALSCIMLDIDHFKAVNDNYGHAVGDLVIKMVAATLKEISRPNDLVGRYGGEEFCVVLPSTTLESAAKVAERMRLSIMKAEMSVPAGEFNVTSSFGVTSWKNTISNAEAFVSQADEALYVAKENGRNRVEIWSGSDEKTDDIENSINDDENTEVEAQVITLTEPRYGLEKSAVSDISGDSNYNGNIHQLDVDNKSSDIHLKLCDNNVDFEPTTEKFCFPSREVMLDRITQAIERAKRSNRNFALFVLDLEKARQINNTMGHTVSEKLIGDMGNKISKTLRSTDCVSIIDTAEYSFSLSQISSYEFAILLADFAQDEIISTILNRIFKELDSPSIVEGSELYLDTSIGVSVYPNDGKDPEQLISNASTAMNEAKLKLGRNNFRFYSAEINIRANQQLKKENELYKAVERDEFVVYYQPKVDLNTGKICGMEALVRWLHPELGIVGPNEFIPLAESNGFIEVISSNVIAIVCRQMKVWEEAGITIVPVAINISPIEFRNKNLANQIISIVEQAELSPEYIELEITENVAMDNLGATVDLIQELTDVGISVSLDDFGTGYCSYSHLKYFSVDKIKIDRSIISGFTDNTFDAAIVSSIITLGDNLGLKIVAEGVETKEQLSFLRDLHCHQIQGYFISKPVSYEEATKFLFEPALIEDKVQPFLGDCFNASTDVGYNAVRVRARTIS